MENDLLTNVLILAAIVFLVYIIINTMNLNKEAFGPSSSSSKPSPSSKPSSSSKPSASSSSSSSSSSSNSGLAGNAASYTANIQSQVIQLQDSTLVSKYRSDYENAIMAVDDLVDNLMLKTALSIDSSNPQQGLTDLVGLDQAKTALNNVMKFVDSSSS